MVCVSLLSLNGSWLSICVLEKRKIIGMESWIESAFNDEVDEGPH